LPASKASAFRKHGRAGELAAPDQPPHHAFIAAGEVGRGAREHDLIDGKGKVVHFRQDNAPRHGDDLIENRRSVRAAAPLPGGRAQRSAMTAPA
jgi:hypothetical protein